jgi:hypothetical protein
MIRPLFKFLTASSLTLLSFFLIHSCKGKDDKTADTTTTEKAGKGEIGASRAVEPVLYELFIDRTTFINSMNSNNKNKNTVVLSYFIESKGSLTLPGWFAKKNKGNIDFDTTPNLKLTVGKQTTVTLSEGDYLGNMNITNKNLNKLDSALKKHPNLTYIVFVPTRKSPVTYEIFLADQTSKTGARQAELTDAIANPSPPRGID